jgi:hypothetical protein
MLDRKYSFRSFVSQTDGAKRVDTRTWDEGVNEIAVQRIGRSPQALQRDSIIGFGHFKLEWTLPARSQP